MTAPRTATFEKQNLAPPHHKETEPGIWKIYLDIWNRVPGG
jgi:hypothetical protein